jgi:hypothetical protein
VHSSLRVQQHPRAAGAPTPLPLPQSTLTCRPLEIQSASKPTATVSTFMNMRGIHRKLGFIAQQLHFLRFHESPGFHQEILRRGAQRAVCAASTTS